MIWSKKLILLCIMILPMFLFGQDSINVVKPDLIKEQTIIVVKPKFNPNPNRALIFSLVIPGAGQVYNGQWWKVPIVYAALGGTAYLVKQNYNEYKRYKVARELLLEGKPNEFSALNPSETALRAARDYYRSNFELSTVALGLIYVLQGIEAYVGAHLKSFDIKDDLGISPVIDRVGTSQYIGLNISRNINSKPEHKKIVAF